MKIIKHLIFVMLLATMGIVSATAENPTLTPYSMYGYGILNDHSSSFQRQMGGVGYAMNSGRQINVKNPASYAHIDSLTFLWDMGASVSMLWCQDGSAKGHAIGGGLDYITMQFPLGKHMGASIGLLPYSSVGYAFGSEIMHGTMENQGSGGLTEGYLGIGGKVAGFSIGANVSYRFGNIINDVYANSESGGQTLFEHVMQVRDWDINIGAQYKAKLDKFNTLTIGTTYSPRKSMHGKTWCSYWDLTSDAKPDTVGEMSMTKKYYQPHTVGAGINYKHERTNKIMVEADVTWQDWSKAAYSALTGEEGAVVFDGMTFSDRWKIAVGGEYVPKIRGNFAERMAYRIGAYYTNDYLNIRGNQVTEYGITAGVGMPTVEGKTIINIGFEWKHRNSSPQKLLGENYFNITLGLNFNELWFWQRKLK